MVELTRRGFLGACIAFAAAPAIVRADSMMRIARPTQGLILPLAMTGAVREIRMYDIRSDSFITRWDIAGDSPDGNPLQIHVAMQDSHGWPTYISDVPGGNAQALQHLGSKRGGIAALPDNREIALKALREHADSAGLRIVHGRLELPVGVHHARFING